MYFISIAFGCCKDILKYDDFSPRYLSLPEEFPQARGEGHNKNRRKHGQVTELNGIPVANCRSTHYNAMKTRYNDPEVDIEHH